ncbi:hypothetical protein BJ138DRAFT_1135921 [Hygrophoropsis aurantiaca]|uniref:Uncharacterized protein n=1 Tax=Hygrophoropsis aurantiaca TaxID=72124 RepID=A0ACB8AC02_9AGAM|nr:hypothetical protein BJ138DRAFT_1135921 [Hygrophoropsis aurantiaca]
MSSMCSTSAESSTSYEKRSLLRSQPVGTHKIHYNASDEWDFVLETPQSIDMSLVLPHFRARHQPVEHRLSMYVGSESSPIKLKVCRPMPRSKFYLEVQAATSNVTVWLPSDFKGHIHYPGRASFSAGFVNRMMANIRLNEEMWDKWDGDEVLVETGGTVTFRMWDVHTNTPENQPKETWKRLFGCARKSPETSMNWDFLLDD